MLTHLQSTYHHLFVLQYLLNNLAAIFHYKAQLILLLPSECSFSHCYLKGFLSFNSRTFVHYTMLIHSQVGIYFQIIILIIISETRGRIIFIHLLCSTVLDSLSQSTKVTSVLAYNILINITQPSPIFSNFTLAKIYQLLS